MATYQVSQSTDDCLRKLVTDFFNLTQTSNPAGALATEYQFGCGMRFANILIPQGVNITSAKLSLYCFDPGIAAIVKTRISASNEDDAATFSGPGNFDTRWAARTTARVDWDNIPVWIPNTWYDSPDITTVIQEIVNRAGWASGNAIVIFWDDFDNRSPHMAQGTRGADSYDESPITAPKLVITYTLNLPTVRTDPATEIK